MLLQASSQDPPVSAVVYAAADWWLSTVRPVSLWLFSEFGAVYKYSDLLTYFNYAYTCRVQTGPVPSAGQDQSMARLDWSRIFLTDAGPCVACFKKFHCQVENVNSQNSIASWHSVILSTYYSSSPQRWHIVGESSAWTCSPDGLVKPATCSNIDGRYTCPRRFEFWSDVNWCWRLVNKFTNFTAQTMADSNVDNFTYKFHINILRILQHFFSFTGLLYSNCQQPTQMPSFVHSLIAAFCLSLKCRCGKCLNGCWTNAEAEASYDHTIFSLIST